MLVPAKLMKSCKLLCSTILENICADRSKEAEKKKRRNPQPEG